MLATPATLILLATAIVYRGDVAAVALGAAAVIEFGAYCIRKAEQAQEARAIAELAVEEYQERMADMASRN